MLSRLALGITAAVIGVAAFVVVFVELPNELRDQRDQSLASSADRDNFPSESADPVSANVTSASESSFTTVTTPETVIIAPADGGSDTKAVMVSASDTRTDPLMLDGSKVWGIMYAFAAPSDAVQVNFYVDDPARTGAPERIEQSAPYDLGGGEEDSAIPFDTGPLGEGEHTITAVTFDEDGSSSISTAKFEVVSLEEAAGWLLPPDVTAQLRIGDATAVSRSSSTGEAEDIGTDQGGPSPTSNTGGDSGPTTSTTKPRQTTTTTSGSSSPAPTTDPGTFDAVVYPGQSIQSVVDSLPQGARILIGSGVHTRQQVKPKTGMTFVGESGAVLDGQNSTEYAFFSFGGDARDVTLSGIDVTGYVQSSEYHGAIYVSHSSGWLIENCEIHNNRYSGINIGTNSTLRNCDIHHNGRIGVKASGAGFRIEGNAIHNNNPNWANDPLWEAGGIKFIESSGGTIRNNNVHHNNGPGIWADVGANNVVIERNTVDSNSHAGIDYEISSGGVIRNNTVRNNGHGVSAGWMWGAGITVRSPNVTVTGNTLSGNIHGIALIQTGRGGADEARNAVVTNNVIINSGHNGAVRSGGSYDLFSTATWEGNEYRYSNIGGDLWRWNDSFYNSSSWQGLGFDQGGVFTAS